MKLPLLGLGLALALSGFGCSKKEAVTNLGVIELAPNTPKHVTIGGVDWTFTETLAANGKATVVAELERKETVEETTNPPGKKVVSASKLAIDLSSAPTGVEVTGYFGKTPASFILKR